MALTSTISGTISMGNKWATFGTYTDADSSGGGDIATGLKMCEAIFLQPSGAAVEGNAPSVDETLPIAGSAVTVVVDANSTGYWLAIGWGR